METKKQYQTSAGGPVLVVDDDIGSRELLVRFLKTIGCKEVLTAGSGEEAIQTIHSRVPSLVLLDYLLPGISGLETFRQIKQIHPRVPVIMVTAYLSREAIQRAEEEGTFDMLLKPLNLQELEKHVMQKLTSSVK